MLKSKDSSVNARIQKNITEDSVILNAGSLIYDNKWVDYSGTVFNVKSYLRGLITDQRLRFFTNTNYAAYLLLGIDINGSLSVIEGTQILYTSKGSVPVPLVYDIIPLVGIVVVQDGSTNLIDGIKPLNENYVVFYSGMGNVLEKNLVGQIGLDSVIRGDTGVCGETGFSGVSGLTGAVGDIGITGDLGLGITGPQGAQGMTGINWDVQVKFDVFSL
jgi:hypothetical protein